MTRQTNVKRFAQAIAVRDTPLKLHLVFSTLEVASAFSRDLQSLLHKLAVFGERCLSARLDQTVLLTVGHVAVTREAKQNALIQAKDLVDIRVYWPATWEKGLCGIDGVPLYMW